MFKRLFWVSAGFGLGVAATRKARQATASLAAEGVAARLRDRWDAALDEGRDEMLRRELALRDVLAAPEPARRAYRGDTATRRGGGDGR